MNETVQIISDPFLFYPLYLGFLKSSFMSNFIAIYQRYNVPDPNQSGSRTLRSTVTALLDLTGLWNSFLGSENDVRLSGSPAFANEIQ